ncbi:uncharacterized protein LOC124930009 [Impatiens glandulifera]|uniref:uncharacterized protein LOC124930009 n=1 Tax=Impatiens glandulifera TaxID=253017 RepID=UPI001FB0BCF1|nr:uncharacterized protein LOC124930009 [Impatiens glandulifera]
MSNLMKLAFTALDITEKNYLLWILDAEIHLAANGLENTIKDENTTSDQDNAKSMIFTKITSQLKLCGEIITNRDMLEKTFSTFHASNVLLLQGRHHSRGRGHGHFSGRARGNGQGRGGGGRHNIRNDDKKDQINKTVENKCYRCGMKGHWSRICRTPKHFINLYQASLKGKGTIESNSTSTPDDDKIAFGLDDFFGFDIVDFLFRA